MEHGGTLTLPVPLLVLVHSRALSPYQVALNSHSQDAKWRLDWGRTRCWGSSGDRAVGGEGRTVV